MIAPTEQQLAAIQNEAAAFIVQHLREVETEFGLAAATAAAQGMTAALVTWGEDAVGMTTREALRHPLNRHDDRA